MKFDLLWRKTRVLWGKTHDTREKKYGTLYLYRKLWNYNRNKTMVLKKKDFDTMGKKL